jgi:aspartoacylase
MGLSLVIDEGSKLTWQIAAYLKEQEPGVNIFRWKGDTKDVSFVNSIAKNGFAIEVGAIPQGVLRADLFFNTEKLIHHILDFIEKSNNEKFQKNYTSVEIYDHIELLDYPRDKNGDIKAMVHPELQDRDYKKLKKGDPLFITLEGETIRYDKDKEMYPLFINEAAYYEKGFAMCLTEKKVIAI